MDIYHRIIDWEQGGPALLMHCDIQNNATPVGGYNLIDGVSGWNEFITEAFIDSSKHEHLIHHDIQWKWDSVYGWVPTRAEEWAPQVQGGGKFENCIAGAQSDDEIFYPHHDAFNFGFEDFTIDFWAKGDHLGNVLDSNYGADIAVFLRYPQLTTTIEFGINGLFRSDARLYLNVFYGVPPGWTTLAIEGTTNLTGSDGVWHHCALVRVWDTLYMYLDGVLEGQMIIGDSAKFESDVKPPESELNYKTTSHRQFDDFHTIKTDAIARQDESYDERAYIDELRIIKGAQWTENFTPPVEPYS